ncbi:Uncharacterised protein [Legionella busanensis]|uniref:Uncharacterized protein n=1 Tax=Legionella busanensis TaxID=190655 RepID=A0A378JTU8_9GAMM|nr:hypothetical protein [Legionella busanensis]STX51612.1 Uncharacterised protein [Legionella busanensis]
MDKEKNPNKPLPENNKDKKDIEREDEEGEGGRKDGHDKTLEDTFPASDPPATY